ncbi:aminoglycoside phosphotransferase family protein [Streptomyces sp. CB01881]|uniref:aminoglycoside phosphotransferase family protein n=1 Tax=Streptomyces sp. CB01881 TaxID=2078691 RepID=UPI000CDC9323|nr:aminoglycoside phosphotransferase family protein [Streptomyces sp. CB01881]AUY48089.1 aminoglycoside phosphotransferase [Streptomyces sp. CB01881]TYC76574.1 aminoglycoside phosphotransferase family protein [Streptomyces sp. CB01881]
MRIGELVGAGRTADVFALDDGRVLRRYRGGEDATGEADVMAYLAERGFPVPAVWPGPAAGELVMQRLSGTTMVEALVSGAITAERAGGMMAELLRRLHAIPARLSADPGHRVLHLDFHPENVVLTPAGPMVIDWATAEEGPPGLDSAMAALILAQAAVTVPAVSVVARAVLSSLLRHLDGIGEEHLAEARTRRAANPTLSPDEVGRLDEAVALVAGTAGS